MAKLITRTWTVRGLDGKRVKHTAHGYHLMVNGKRERLTREEWTRDDALAALVGRQKAVAAGKVERQADRTLGQLAEEYLTYKRTHGKRSVGNDAHYLRKRLLPALGADLPARRLTAEQVARYEQRRSAEVSIYAVCNELACLGHMLRLARRWGYLEAVPEVTLPKKPRGRERFLDEDEIRRLLEAADRAENPHLGAIVRVAVNTGMRRGEMLKLTWDRVNLATGTITLYRTKSGEPRAVPMNQAVYDLLVALTPDAARRTGLVFPRRDGAVRRDVRAAFKVAAKAAEITNVRFHDLRHTAASHMIMRGRSLREVGEILGHSDMRMTLRYAHLSAASKRAAVDALDGLTPAAKPREMAQEMAHGADVGGQRAVSTRQISASV